MCVCVCEQHVISSPFFPPPPSSQDQQVFPLPHVPPATIHPLDTSDMPSVTGEREREREREGGGGGGARKNGGR